MKLRNNENRIAFIIVGSVLLFVSLLWFAFKTPSLNPRLEKENYTINHQWEMPSELNEISGITWIGNNKIACVQDEDGIIFIYNLSTSSVEKRINFAQEGDYEGITVVDSTAYVLRSDGEIFEIKNYMGNEFVITNHRTLFSGKNNMESITADPKNNRLLLTAKDKELEEGNFKSIYAFNLETKKVEPNPIIRFSFDDSIFSKKDADDDDKANLFYPSDISIHPTSGNIYLLEGKNPRLLIIDSTGKPLQLHSLQKESFPQPEGILFSPEGTLYISNEGKKGTANILEVELDQKL